MDIAGLSMSLANIDLQSQVGVNVLSNAMDLNEDLGKGLVNMIDSAAMEKSVNPYLGGNFDVRT